MEIRGKAPKELQYITTLQKYFSEGLFSKLKRKAVNGDKEYSRSELAEVLTHKNDDYAYQFIDKLIEEDVLKHAGKRKNASGTVDVYAYQGNKALLKAFSDTDFYQELRPLLLDTLQKAENKDIL